MSSAPAPKLPPGAVLAAPMKKKNGRPVPPKKTEAQLKEEAEKKQKTIDEAVQKMMEGPAPNITWKSSALYHPLASGVTRVPLADALLAMPPPLVKQSLYNKEKQDAAAAAAAVAGDVSGGEAAAKAQPKKSIKKKLVGDEQEDDESAAGVEAAAAAAKGKKKKAHEDEQRQLEYLNRIDPVLAISKCMPAIETLSICLTRDFYSVPRVLGSNAERASPALQLGTPRGLINGANACFVASVLQILLQVPAFATVCVSAALAFQRRKAEFKFIQARNAEIKQKKNEEEKVEEEGEERKKKKLAAEQQGASAAKAAEEERPQKRGGGDRNNQQKPAPAAAQASSGDQKQKQQQQQQQFPEEAKPVAAITPSAAAPLPPVAAAKEPQEFTASLLGRWMLSYWQTAGSAFSLPELSVLPAHVEEMLAALPEKERRRSIADFKGGVQQDAHEFLQMLFDRVDLDCKMLGLRFTRDSLYESSSSPASAASSGAAAAAAAAAASSSFPSAPSSSAAAKKGGGSDAAVRTLNGNYFDPNSPCSLIFGGELQVQVKEKGYADASLGQSAPASRLVEPFTIFTCSVASGGNSVMQCIEKALAKEIIEAAKKDANDQTRQQKVQLAPQYALIVQLARWGMKEVKPGVWDVVKLENVVKIDQRLTIPLAPGGTAKYRLRAVLCHRGKMPTQGHYVTYVYQTPSEFTAQQFRSGAASAGAAVVGKEQQPLVWSANDARVSVLTDLSIVEKDTPYLLCYVRE